MARSFDYKGLLYSPEVLGGIGLLTAGLSGKAPDTALPMMMQGMKTASMFSAMEKEEEFVGINWRETLKLYLSAKGGSL